MTYEPEPPHNDYVRWISASFVIFLVGTALVAFWQPQAALADCYVNGYYTSRGTWVNGYYRTCPDGNPWNNYSTEGNYNPYNGRKGYIDPYRSNYGTGYNSYRSNYGTGYDSYRSNYGTGYNSYRSNYGTGYDTYRSNYGTGYNSYRSNYGTGYNSYRSNYGR